MLGVPDAVLGSIRAALDEIPYPRPLPVGEGVNGIPIDFAEEPKNGSLKMARIALAPEIGMTSIASSIISRSALLKMRLAVSERLSRQLTYSNIIRLLEDPYPLTRES